MRISSNRILQVVARALGLLTARRLLAELKAYTPVLPVLSNQLKDVSADLSKEVGALCVGFQQMAMRARESVNVAAGMFSNTGENSQSDVIQTCRSTMTGLLDHMEQRQGILRTGIEQMERIDQSVQQVLAILEQVDQTSFANRLVALNAKIEAVHLGQAGAGFEVVAEQISHQAERSSDLTEQVASVLTNMTKEVSSAAAELRRLADLETEHSQNARTAVEDNLKNLELASRAMQSTLEKAGANAGELAGDINKSIISLQFQDRVTQRIEHVVHSLEAMSKALAVHQVAETDEYVERKREVSESLRSSYTMESERVAHSAIDYGAKTEEIPHQPDLVAVAPAAAPADSEQVAEIESGDVELF